MSSSPRTRSAPRWTLSRAPSPSRASPRSIPDAISKQQRHFFPLGGFEKHSRVRAAHASRDIAARSRPDRLIATHASLPQVSLKPGKVSIRAGDRVRAVPTRARRARHFPICAHRERFEHPAGAHRFSAAGRAVSITGLTPSPPDSNFRAQGEIKSVIAVKRDVKASTLDGGARALDPVPHLAHKLSSSPRARVLSPRPDPTSEHAPTPSRRPGRRGETRARLQTRRKTVARPSFRPQVSPSRGTRRNARRRWRRRRRGGCRAGDETVKYFRMAAREFDAWGGADERAGTGRRAGRARGPSRTWWSPRERCSGGIGGASLARSGGRSGRVREKTHSLRPFPHSDVDARRRIRARGICAQPRRAVEL